MFRMIRWEIGKILSHKLLWVVMALCILLAFLYECDRSYNYQYGKRFYERDLYQYRLEIYRQYPGELSQYSDEIRTRYKELFREYRILLNECAVKDAYEARNDCTIDEYNDFMSSNKIVRLVIYTELNKVLEKSKKYEHEGFTYDGHIIESLKYYKKDNHSFLNRRIELKIKRIEELRDETRVFVSHQYFLNNYIDAAIFYSYLIIIVVVMSLVPVFSYEHDYNTYSLIGASKIGRNVFLSKIFSGILFALIIFSIFFAIHVSRFSFNQGLLHYLNHPLYDLNNYNTVPWFDLSILMFIILFWLLFIILVMITALIVLTISIISRKVVYGIIISVLYFLYPYLIENILDIKLNYLFSYMLNYLHVVKVFENFDKLLLLGDRSSFVINEYKYWGMNVLAYNGIVLMLLLGYSGYRFMRQVDIT